jgi:hypothetical protein
VVTYGASYAYTVTSFDKLNNESNATSKISVIVTGVEAEPATPTMYSLDQNYPNPFNPVTTLSFSIGQANNTSLTIYDVLGREITTIVNDYLDAGMHQYQFSGANLASGVYLYRIVSGSFVQTKKMSLIK